MENKNIDYTTNSGGLESNIDTALQYITNNPVKKAVVTYSNIADQLISGTSTATKLILSQAGIARQTGRNIHSENQTHDSNIKDSYERDLIKLNNISVNSENVIDRYDSGRDFYFKAGDFFLPLTITYNCEGTKDFAESQLVDGINIIERVALRPQIIDVTMRFERKKATNVTTNIHITKEEGIAQTYIDNLSALMNDLWRKKDIFMIENKFINEELGVQYVVMRSYSVNPIVGSHIFEMRMNLYEINMTENIIFDTDANLEGGFNIR